ncbi:hypothetical protein NDU88_006708 [Pleurodeles waltl]|uniref:Uncharacterized protein n=1 Tax=Pleurodeles waltl TaxID=8319 RepID=A0AAV7VRG2_PLEWA|nr:hypothetical protein NDU88_006708 [Pleurodeles waltl]
MSMAIRFIEAPVSTSADRRSGHLGAQCCLRKHTGPVRGSLKCRFDQRSVSELNGTEGVRDSHLTRAGAPPCAACRGGASSSRRAVARQQGRGLLRLQTRATRRPGPEVWQGSIGHARVAGLRRPLGMTGSAAFGRVLEVRAGGSLQARVRAGQV